MRIGLLMGRSFTEDRHQAGIVTWLREWGASAEGALIGGTAFVFAPNLVAVGSHGHGSQLVDSAYLPLLMWLAARWMRAGRLSDLAWLSLAGGFQLLRGHVQICFYTWLAVALYVLVEWAAAFRRPGALRPLSLRAAAVVPPEPATTLSGDVAATLLNDSVVAPVATKVSV